MNERVRDSQDVSVADMAGLSHGEVLALDVPATHQLVENLVEAGTVGTIAALPETHKSWLAVEIAHKVAAGGNVLGRCKVLERGPVGYWWQDDSEANEIRRVQAYARRHDFGGELAIRWHLNEGLRLPDDLPALRREIEREGQVLVVLDSLYNFLPGLNLKDEDVAGVLAQLKAGVCDPTGCAIGFVDHAAWPTAGNEGRTRGYGSVFKAAVIRWGIYLEANGDTLFVEARGNNLAGLKRTAAVWNADRLELQLVEAPAVELDLVGRLKEFLRDNPGATTTLVTSGVEGKDATIRALLEGNDAFSSVPPALFRKPRNATCWALTKDVPGLLDNNPGPERADVGPTLRRETDDNVGPHPFTPVGGEGGPTLGSQTQPESGPTLDARSENGEVPEAAVTRDLLLPAGRFCVGCDDNERCARDVDCRLDAAASRAVGS